MLLEELLNAMDKRKNKKPLPSATFSSRSSPQTHEHRLRILSVNHSLSYSFQ